MELLIPYLKAFLVGGAFCAVGQVFIDYTKLTPARILVAYVVAGVILGGLGVYQPIIDFAGAGATVPLSVFGALLAREPGRPSGKRGCWGCSPGGLPPRRRGLRRRYSSACWRRCSSAPGISRSACIHSRLIQARFCQCTQGPSAAFGGCACTRLRA